MHELDTQVLAIEVEDPQYGEVAIEAARQASAKAQVTENRYRKAVEEKQHQDTMPRENSSETPPERTRPPP